jgi:hypothetical protein
MGEAAWSHEPSKVYPIPREATLGRLHDLSREFMERFKQNLHQEIEVEGVTYKLSQ